MLIHADSYHPNKNIKHFIGRNVIFSYFHFATVKKRVNRPKKNVHTYLQPRWASGGAPWGTLMEKQG